MPHSSNLMTLIVPLGVVPVDLLMMMMTQIAIESIENYKTDDPSCQYLPYWTA
jgi:hypothetical protein